MDRLNPAIVTYQLAFEGVHGIRGVTFDGTDIWFAHGVRGEVVAIDPAFERRPRTIRVPGSGGLAFDGEFLWVAAGAKLRRVHRATGQILAELDSPAGADTSGLGYGDGHLWIASYRAKRVYRLELSSGLVTITFESPGRVTGVSVRGAELWYAALDDHHHTARSQLRHVAQPSGETIESRELATGILVSGVAFDGAGRLWCGDPMAGLLRLVAL